MNKHTLLLLLLSLCNSLYSLDPVILLFGPPGSGKGTFADYALERGYNHLSAGDLVRDEIKKQTPFGIEIEAIVKRGDVVDSTILFQLVKERVLSLTQENKPFIIDGYGRTEPAIQALCTLLINQELDRKIFILLLEADDDACTNRILSRLVCSDCHHVYNTSLDTARANEQCPRCQTGILELRLNDTIDVIKKRLNKYREEILQNYMKSCEYFPILIFNANQERSNCLEFYDDLLSKIKHFEGTAQELIDTID